MLVSVLLLGALAADAENLVVATDAEDFPCAGWCAAHTEGDQNICYGWGQARCGGCPRCFPPPPPPPPPPACAG
eukprot:188514-Prymnesium_polylepis.1